MRAALFLRRAKGSFFPNKTGRPHTPPPREFSMRQAGYKNLAAPKEKIFSAAVKKRAEREKFKRSRSADRRAARILPPDVAEEFGNGKWREIIGNYGKIKMVWGGFGFRICVRKLFAPTP